MSYLLTVTLYNNNKIPKSLQSTSLYIYLYPHSPVHGCENPLFLLPMRHPEKKDDLPKLVNSGPCLLRATDRSGVLQCLSKEDSQRAEIHSFIYFLMTFIFSTIVGLQCSVSFLLYSKVTQSHIHVSTFFFSHYLSPS